MTMSGGAQNGNESTGAITLGDSFFSFASFLLLGRSYSDAMKLGRNELCHCGSGKKYKKCHLDMDKKGVDQVLGVFAKAEEERMNLKSMGIYINYVDPIMFNGRKVWALGDKLYPNRDPNETFHDFVLFILAEVLGFEWIKQQKGLPPENQHFIVKCMNEFDLWKLKLLKDSQGKAVVEASPNGWVKSLISLAFDIATLRHTSNLPEALLHRLKIPDQYQGARYEITIAAVIVRLDFRVDWIEAEEGVKHCEFIATHSNGTKIAVEAKSRHRGGVLHAPGIINEEGAKRGDVNPLITDAFKKTEYGKMPFLVFIDVNAPFSEHGDWTEVPWVRDVMNRARRGAPNTPENPSSWNAIYFTNFSPHYQTDQEAAPNQVLQSTCLYCVHEVPDRSLYPGILNALQHYGEVPDISIKK